MKQLMKRGMALLMLIAMLVCMIPATAIPSSAAGYVYNWGTREVEATELSSYATAWYARYNVTLENLLSNYTGSSNTSSVPSSSLYKQLQNLMRNAHSNQTSYAETKELYRYTDCQNGGGKISSFYSGAAIGPGWGEGGSWNREHTWPNSKGLGGNDENDIMMLRPTATSENSSRGNTAYGDSNGFYNPNSASGGKYDLRGDCARIALYVYVRWGNTQYMWNGSGVMQSKEVLLRWMEEDPVDTWELGRNDAVQSITGTRNVFVDYPELCFALFDTAIPDMTTPSGYAGSNDYTITATSDNTSFGTVSVNRNTITAQPKEGYYASGYTVTSGTATVTQKGNVFTVSASADCTVQIHFAKKSTVTVSFSGAYVESVICYAGDSISLPQTDAPAGFNFVGWTESPLSAETTSKPSCFVGSYTPTDNAILYALFSYLEEGSGSGTGDYVKVTESRSDWSGEYVIVYEQGPLVFDSSLGTIDVKDNYKTVNISNNTISAAAGDPYKVTISAVNGGYSILGTNGQYFSGTSGMNKLNGSSSADVNTISLDASGNANIVSNTSYLRYNAGDTRFRYYKSTTYSSQKPVALYLKDGETRTVYYTSTVIVCDHDDGFEQHITEATCQTEGVIVYSCNNCSFSYSEKTPVTGHSYGPWIATDNGNVRTCIYCSAQQNGVCITKQPKTTYTANGKTAKVSVEATGDGLKYQWYVKSANGSKYSRSSNTSATYSCQMNNDRKDRFIRCEITDKYGNSVWTKTVRLRMKASITSQPKNRAVVVDKAAKFTVSAVGSGLTYQWQYRKSSTDTWSNSSASTCKTKTLSITGAVHRHGYQYRCRIKDSAGNTVYTEPVTLYVLGIKTQPKNITASAGTTAKMTVKATGVGLSYQWQCRTSASGKWITSSASGNKTTTLKIPAAIKRNGYQYRCKITDKYGNVVYTQIIKLTVKK